MFAGRTHFLVGTASHRRLTGGRTWWAHYEFTPINIELTILPKKIEDLREVVGPRWKTPAVASRIVLGETPACPHRRGIQLAQPHRVRRGNGRRRRAAVLSRQSRIASRQRGRLRARIRRGRHDAACHDRAGGSTGGVHRTRVGGRRHRRRRAQAARGRRADGAHPRMPQDENRIWISPSGANIAWFKDPWRTRHSAHAAGIA
jgi:hypothetical protein